MKRSRSGGHGSIAVGCIVGFLAGVALCSSSTGKETLAHGNIAREREKWGKGEALYPAGRLEPANGRLGF